MLSRLNNYFDSFTKLELHIAITVMALKQHDNENCVEHVLCGSCQRILQLCFFHYSASVQFSQMRTVSIRCQLQKSTEP